MVTRRQTIAGLAGLAAVASAASESGAAQNGDNAQAFAIDELLARRESSGRAYLPFLNLPTLRCGLYVLPAGGDDAQTPHETDEVYYALSGKATLNVEDELLPVTAGSVLYVKAQAEHRFVDIEEELRLLVFFD